MSLTRFFQTRLPQLFALASAAALLLFILLFLRVDLPQRRSLHELWNAAHLLLFAALAFATLRGFHASARRLPLWQLIIIALLVSAVLGGAIEYWQGKLDREASLQDWMLDMAGAALGCAVYFIAAHQPAWRAHASTHEKSLLGVVGLAVVASCTPLWLALADEVTAHYQFPVLADFNSPLESTRFQADIDSRLENGELQVFFHPAGYANINWKFFPRNWSNYSRLVIELRNPESASVSLSCRIHDAAHETYYRYDDRFSRNYMLPPGDNALRIDLREVASAPVSRTIDMRAIASMHCFTHQLSTPVTLVFTQIRLE